MPRMKILVTTSNAVDFIGADTLSYFDLELGRQADCKYAGKGYLLYMNGESTNQTVKRLYGHDPPDWVYGGISGKKGDYRTAGRMIDLHRELDKKIDRINKQKLDHLFFYYRQCKYASQTRALQDWTLIDKDYWWNNIHGDKTWLPWSYEPKIFHPSDEEPLYDVTLLGDVGLPAYPFRTVIYNELPELCRENKWRLLRGNRAPGKFILDGKTLRRKSVIHANPELREKYIVGEDYAEALRRSKVFIFGTSILKYPIKKWFEGMGSGTCILADEPSMAKELGIVDGYNYIKISPDDWKNKLQWILENESVRKKIAHQAYETMKQHHTHETRVKEMLDVLRRYDYAQV